MAFVNEFVSPEDFEKYGLKKINEQYKMLDSESNWTIDKEREIYIRKISWMAPSPGYMRFHMHWKGYLFFVYIAVKSNTLLGLKGMDLPKALESNREEILSDLKLALKTRGDAGVFSVVENLETSFDF